MAGEARALASRYGVGLRVAAPAHPQTPPRRSWPRPAAVAQS